MNAALASPDAGDEDERGPPSVTFANGGLSWTRVATPRLLSRVAAGFFLLTCLSRLAMMSDTLEFLVVVSLFALLAWPLWIVSYILSLTQNAFIGALEVSKTEVILHRGTRRWSIPLAKIAGALVVERQVFGAFVPTVEIELTNGDVLTARLPEPRSANAVVKRLGFGAGGRRVHARLAKPTARLLHPLLGLIGYVVGAAVAFVPTVGIGAAFEIGSAAYPVFALGIYALLKRLVRAPDVTVGDDGVIVRRGARRPRFIPRNEIVRVHSAPEAALVLETRSGESIVVGGALVDGPRRHAVAGVIQERLGPAAAPSDRLAHYDRAGRALAEWRAHLSRAMNDASYRQNAATVDEAAAVLQSAEASPEQRIGAALALRVSGEPPARLRVAIEAAADERVRDALAAVADAEDADGDVILEKALRRLQSP